MTTPMLTAPLLLNRLRLRQVALLLQVRALGTLRAAATQMGMTQPAATNMLKELEAALGVRLFEREGRGLVVTAAGAAVMAHFEGLNGSLAAMARDIDGLRLGGGALAVGSILAPSPTLLTRTVARIKQEQPRLRVSVLTETSDRLLDMLEQGQLNIVIGRMAEGHDHRDYVTRLLEGEALSVVVGLQHPLARTRKTMKLAVLIDQPWVLQPRGSPMREVLEREFRLQGLGRPLDLVETASILTTIFLIGEAPMVAVVPASLASHYAERGLLRVLPVNLSSELEPYGSIVRRGRPLSAAAARFLELLHGEPGHAAGGQTG